MFLFTILDLVMPCGVKYNATNIDSSNGLSPARHQLVTWADADLLLSGPLETNVSEI